MKVAGSLTGFKHSEETMEKFKNREVNDMTKENLSKAATGRILTEEDKQKISLSRQGKVMSLDTRSKLSAHMANLIGISIIVKNIITNVTAPSAFLQRCGAQKMNIKL